MYFVNNDFYTFKNDTGSCLFQFQDCDGNPVDLTGWNLQFIIKECKFKDDNKALFQKEFIIDSAEFQMDFEKGDINFEPGSYYYTLRVYDENNIKTLLDGKFIVGRTSFYAAPAN